MIRNKDEIKSQIKDYLTYLDYYDRDDIRFMDTKKKIIELIKKL